MYKWTQLELLIIVTFVTFVDNFLKIDNIHKQIVLVFVKLDLLYETGISSGLDQDFKNIGTAYLKPVVSRLNRDEWQPIKTICNVHPEWILNSVVWSSIS